MAVASIYGRTQRRGYEAATALYVLFTTLQLRAPAWINALLSEFLELCLQSYPATVDQRKTTATRAKM
jgi:hypothetical protein